MQPETPHLNLHSEREFEDSLWGELKSSCLSCRRRECGRTDTSALLDTGAGSSYASAALLDKLPKRSQSKEVRRIEMMLSSTTREVAISSICVGATDGSYKMKVDVTRVDRGESLMIENPHYQKLIESYNHLEGVCMEDNSLKPFLPVHLILDASAYAAIKTTEAARVGLPGEPVAEKTKFG